MSCQGVGCKKSAKYVRDFQLLFLWCFLKWLCCIVNAFWSKHLWNLSLNGLQSCPPPHTHTHADTQSHTSGLPQSGKGDRARQHHKTRQQAQLQSSLETIPHFNESPVSPCPRWALNVIVSVKQLHCHNQRKLPLNGLSGPSVGLIITHLFPTVSLRCWILPLFCTSPASQ